MKEKIYEFVERNYQLHILVYFYLKIRMKLKRGKINMKRGRKIIINSLRTFYYCDFNYFDYYIFFMDINMTNA